eukprot:scaffold12469_cov16-Prasinocladus_malaysianus.AAC.2
MCAIETSSMTEQEQLEVATLLSIIEEQHRELDLFDNIVNESRDGVDNSILEFLHQMRAEYVETKQQLVHLCTIYFIATNSTRLDAPSTANFTPLKVPVDVNNEVDMKAFQAPNIAEASADSPAAKTTHSSTAKSDTKHGGRHSRRNKINLANVNKKPKGDCLWDVKTKRCSTLAIF